jgi:hypothetical protein
LEIGLRPEAAIPLIGVILLPIEGTPIQSAEEGVMRTCVGVGLIAVAVALYGCGGSGDDDGPICGDGFCTGGENAASCPGDCQGFTCSPADPSDCTGETICVDGACVAAFGRVYTFSMAHVVANSLDPNGEAWDALGGAPDPFVEVELNGTVILTTSVVADVFEASFSDQADATIPAGSTLTFTAYDEDVSVNDPMISCVADQLTADFLRNGILTCTGQGPTAGTSIDLAVEPR